jgi:hypothetical protein
MQPQPQRTQPANRTPYGYSAGAENASAPTPRFLLFGVPYLVLNLPVYIFLFLLGVIRLILLGSGDSFGVKVGSMVMAVGLVLLGYTIAAGVLAIRGRITGVWMGVAHAIMTVAVILLILLHFGGGVMQSELFVIILIIALHAGVLALGIRALRQYSAHNAATA